MASQWPQAHPAFIERRKTVEVWYAIARTAESALGPAWFPGLPRRPLTGAGGCFQVCFPAGWCYELQLHSGFPVSRAHPSGC